MGGEVRYCTTEDGVRIAYTVSGAGPPLVVLPIIYSSFSLMHELPWYGEFLGRVSEGRTLIRYDMRGCGLSEREVQDVQYVAQAKDVQAVLDALGLGRASVLVGSHVGPVALSFAANQSERVASLVVFGANARLRGKAREVWAGLAQMARGDWELAARTLAGLALRRVPEEAVKMARIYVRSSSGDFAARSLEDNRDFDLTEVLRYISARTLVIHSEADTFYPFVGGQEIAERIPNARLLPLEGNLSLTTLGDKTAIVADAINSFLDEDAETRRIPVAPKEGGQPSGLRTVLFTDLVGHTEMMQRLGDTKGRDVLREHERITREVLKAHGGTEVKTMGDGFMASFGSVTKAVECAVALQRAFTDREGEPLSVRVGLNAGEPIEEDGDLFGATVILASRIAAKAEGGEILVADTVRGLCSGKGFLFADRGEFVAKGIEEPVRVCEVSWRG